MIYPKLINWWKWRYDYFKKKKENGKWNPREEKPCYKIVDVVYKTFWRKDYFVKLSQSQKGHIYFIVRKRGGRLIEEEKDALHKKIFEVSASVFNRYSDKHYCLGENYFLSPKLIKDASWYHFHYFLVSYDKNGNECLWTLVFCHFW